MRLTRRGDLGRVYTRPHHTAAEDHELRFALASVLAIVIFTSPANALPGQCKRFEIPGSGIKRPDKPSCADMMKGAVDRNSFDSCKIEMDDYQFDVSAYLDCLDAEFNEAVTEYNGEVERFICQAPGEHCRAAGQ